jgi:hypothetical protein
MWMYLAVAVGIVVALNLLIVLVVAGLARHAEPGDELATELRARLEEYARKAA